MCCVPRELGLGLCVVSAVQVTGRVEGQITKLNRGVLLLKPNRNEALSAIFALGVFNPHYLAKHVH